MSDQPMNILLIEDNPGDARLIREMFAQDQEFRCHLDWASDLSSGLRTIAQGHTDVVLLDLGLPDSSGLDSLRAVRGAVPPVPVIIVMTGWGDEEIGVLAVQEGAQDYLFKGHVDSDLLIRSIRYAVERAEAKLALQQAKVELEQQVRERTAQLADTVRALEEDIAQRRAAEESLRWELEVNRALSEVSLSLLSEEPNLATMAQITLAYAKQLTQSEHGYVGTIDPPNQDLVVHTLTAMMGRECQVTGEDRRFIFPLGPDGRYPRLFGLPLNSRQPFFTNSPATHEASGGTPPGHIPLRNFLSVPAVLGGRLLGQVAVANSSRDFSGRDLEAVRRLTELYAVALARKQTEDALLESEHRFQQVAENAQEWIWEIDGNGLFSFSSPAVKMILGYEPDELIGARKFFDLFPPEGPEELTHAIRQAFAERRPLCGFTTRNLDTTGQEIWLSISAVPIVEPNGNLLGFRGVTTNISERKRAELDLLASEVKYRRIVETSLEGVLALDENEIITFVNTRMTDLLGFERHELLGHPLAHFLPEEELADHRQKWADRKAGKAERYERRFRSKDGPERLMLTNATPLFDPDGRFVGSFAMLTDITERERAETALRESEIRFRTLFETADDAIMILDGETFVDCNARAVQIFGLKNKDELLNRSPAFFSPEKQPNGTDSHEKARQYLQGALGGQPQRFTWKHIRGDGTQIDFEVSLAVFRIGGKHLVQAIGRDITERKHFEDELARSNSLLEAVIKQAPFGIQVLVGNGPNIGLLIQNDESERIAGKNPQTRSASDAMTLHELTTRVFDPEGKTEIPFEELPAFRAFAGDNVSNEEFLFRRTDGSDLFVEASASPIFDSNGKALAVVASLHDITDRRRAQWALQASEMRFRGIFEQSPIGIAVYDAGSGLISMNPAARSIFGITDFASVLGQRFFDDPNLPPEVLKLLVAGETARFEMHYDFAKARAGGFPTTRADSRDIDALVTPLRFEAGQINQGFVLLAHDITDRKRLELQLQVSQKMEAVGQLAGGVAHDFNNILTAILGNVELVRERLKERPARLEGLIDGMQQIERSAQRAAGLTRQLLAFSRRQIVQPQLVNINDNLTEMEKMLRRLLTENIHLEVLREPQLWAVRVDPGQFEQVLMNLVVNARDSMPEGGDLILETRNVFFDEGQTRSHADAHPGPYVALQVSDTGCGMEPKVLERIFEPFFSTKGMGQGTGLGLAMVYGIVKQAGGHILVYSEPGHGSTFKVYLPAVTEALEAVSLPETALAPLLGTETILLCEDDPAVRNITAAILQKAGYTVLSAENGARALQLASEHSDPIQLLVTDVIIPDTNGKKLADELCAQRPDLRVLFVSGYTSNVIAHHGVLNAGIEFLEKPFTRLSLLKRVREVLGR